MADIDIIGVERRYGSFTALHAVDLKVQDQEFLVLLGASGCGKTTLLRLLAGLDRQSSGEIRIGGKTVDDIPARRRGIAMVFQNYAVFPHLTVFENIAFGLKMRKLPAEEIDTKVRRAAGLICPNASAAAAILDDDFTVPVDIIADISHERVAEDANDNRVAAEHMRIYHRATETWQIPALLL